ncbi:hypothetical protein NDU88_000400 [Pleurodeles waltl]|uniref:Reverse transcriptase/retrotransposon-derived protein RNase H-like domain-containing protein n=1 Tax=Pleurodeles waltl TaxID=8319 RepID=A0AAV7URK0_PLEWA|nr:hypothetical protein NDU88_000400 [Pleurodeles waltl]
MGRHRQSVTSQGNAIEQYTKPVPLSQQQTRSGGPEDVICAPGSTGEPSQAKLLAAIQGSRVALEGKIETMAVEVYLLRADLRNVSEMIKVAEGSIVELQTEDDILVMGKDEAQHDICLKNWLPTLQKNGPSAQFSTSSNRIGAVLFQKDDDGKETTVAFAFRALSPAEKLYSVIEKEPSAVVWGLEHFRSFVRGLKVMMR